MFQNLLCCLDVRLGLTNYVTTTALGGLARSPLHPLGDKHSSHDHMARSATGVYHMTKSDKDRGSVAQPVSLPWT